MNDMIIPRERVNRMFGQYRDAISTAKYLREVIASAAHHLECGASPDGTARERVAGWLRDALRATDSTAAPAAPPRNQHTTEGKS